MTFEWNESRSWNDNNNSNKRETKNTCENNTKW